MQCTISMSRPSFVHACSARPGFRCYKIKLRSTSPAPALLYVISCSAATKFYVPLALIFGIHLFYIGIRYGASREHDIVPHTPRQSSYLLCLSCTAMNLSEQSMQSSKQIGPMAVAEEPFYSELLTALRHCAMKNVMLAWRCAKERTGPLSENLCPTLSFLKIFLFDAWIIQ